MDEFLTELIIALLLSALIGIFVGQFKGRPVWGFALSLLLGPIGWLLVAVGPNLKPKCPDCGGVVVAGAKKCKHCGTVIGFIPEEYERQKAQMATAKPRAQRQADPVEEWAQTQPQSPDDSIPCPHCSAPLAMDTLTEGNNTCPSCAGVFTVEPAEVTA